MATFSDYRFAAESELNLVYIIIYSQSFDSNTTQISRLMRADSQIVSEFAGIGDPFVSNVT